VNLRFAPNLSMLWAGLPLADRFERAAQAGFGAVAEYWPLISHVQVADVSGRHEPGTGEINYPFILDHLDRKGYPGAVGLEYRPSTGRIEDSFGWLGAYRRRSC
jgi:hydroxypyruvate isomerase